MKALLLSMLALCLASCSSPSPDLKVVNLEKADDAIHAPEAHYREPAWLDDTLLAFSYRTSAFGDQLGDYQIAYTQLNSNIWQDINLPPDPNSCSPVAGLVKDLSRLPDGNLGYTYDCLDNGISGILYTWDKEQEIVEKVYWHLVPFRIGPFTFAPDMSEWLQVNENGLSHELYRVKNEDEIEVQRILSHFKRAGSPAWSPDGNTIAFAGNETVDESSGWQDLVLLPWDLYLMDADGSNVRTIFPQIGNPYNLRWSPDGRWLFFSGSRQSIGAEGGIWMLNVETLEIYRIWPHNAFFDLSPSGDKIIIIVEEGEEGEVVRTYPVVYWLPDL